MQGIKAFVGHSFLEEDKLLVRAFTDHFDTLRKSYGGGFAWDHAEEAEALPLSQKVLAKIEGKNLFIGICTRKEQIFDRSKLKTSWYGRRTLVDEKFVWKTSDWIIQEIGLAVGRKMYLIIFLENGVRAPGGLHGDIEYISFSRESPHQAFDKFLQMLSAISPEDGDKAGAETKAAPPETKIAPETVDDSNLDPKFEWTLADYDNAQWAMTFSDKPEIFAKIDAAFKASAFAQNDGYAEWQGRFEYYRLLTRRPFDFEKLKRLHREHPQSATLAEYLAEAYVRYDDLERATTCYEQATSAAAEKEKIIYYLGETALLYRRMGNSGRSQEMVEQLRDLAQKNASHKTEVAHALRQISTHDKDELAEIVLMEYLTEQAPSDTRKRFDLAYKHSETKSEDMALYHYLKITPAERNATTWNNLGVAYTEFQLHARGVQAYTHAADAGSTLAMSNLGYKSLTAGFLKDAEAQCKRALGKEDYEVNVPNLLSRIKEIPDEESKKLQSTLDNVRPKAMFYRDAGESLTNPLPKVIAPFWKAAEGKLKAQLTGNQLVLSGTYERPASTLASVLLGIKASTTPATKMNIQYQGSFQGRFFVGTVTRKPSDYTPTLAEGPTKVLMILDTNAHELRAMENYESRSPSFSSLKAAE